MGTCVSMCQTSLKCYIYSNFSLGGNTKTVIICTVTAAEEDQTKSTLEFASRAKRIVNHAKVTNFTFY